jgi:hypothetical protein
LQKWILSSLFADGRLRPVPRQDNGITRQNEDLLANPADQQLMIAPWEVCSADAAGEKYIAGEQDLVGGRIEAKASGTMAGNKQNTKGRSAKIKLCGLLDQKISLDGFRFEKETPVFKEVRVCHERDTILVIGDQTFGGPLDLGRVIEMVGVTMRQDQQIESYSQVADPLQRAGWSIDQNISSWRLDEVRVRIENTANKSLKVEHSDERFGNLG